MNVVLFGYIFTASHNHVENAAVSEGGDDDEKMMSMKKNLL